MSNSDGSPTLTEDFLADAHAYAARHAQPDAAIDPPATRPANASGTLGTITVTAPLGFATGKASAWGTDAWRADDEWGTGDAGDEGGAR